LTPTKQTICILGSYSGRNAGDAAILDGLLADLKPRFPQARFTVPTFNPGFLKRNYDPAGLVPVSLKPWHGAIKIFGLPTFRAALQADLILITDAILYDLDFFDPFHNFLSTLQLVLPWAQRRGIPVAGYNVSLGPVLTARGERALRRVLKSCERLILRDRESAALLRRLVPGAPEPLLGADCALGVPREQRDTLRRLRARQPFFRSPRPLLGFNVNAYLNVYFKGYGRRFSRQRFVAIAAAALRHAIDRMGLRVLLIQTVAMDTAITRELEQAVGPRPELLWVSNRELHHRELAQLFSEAELHVGMRTHSLILAAAAGTPILGLIATPKNRGFLASLGLTGVEFEGLTETVLIEALEAAWAGRERLRAELAPRVEAEKRRAREAREQLAPLLEK
jgi:polysaccharide pyruvyl transferase WcaK-like protein